VTSYYIFIISLTAGSLPALSTLWQMETDNTQKDWAGAVEKLVWCYSLSSGSVCVCRDLFYIDPLTDCRAGKSSFFSYIHIYIHIYIYTYISFFLLKINKNKKKRISSLVESTPTESLSLSLSTSYWLLLLVFFYHITMCTWIHRNRW
jgi:hypothetical protein